MGTGAGRCVLLGSQLWLVLAPSAQSLPAWSTPSHGAPSWTYSSQPLGWEAGSPAAQGSLVRMIGSPPGTQGSSEWGQGKEDGAAGGRRPLQGRKEHSVQGEAEVCGLYGRRGSVFVTWLGRCPNQSFLSSPRGTPRRALGLHTQTNSKPKGKFLQGPTSPH